MFDHSAISDRDDERIILFIKIKKYNNCIHSYKYIIFFRKVYLCNFKIYHFTCNFICISFFLYMHNCKYKRFARASKSFLSKKYSSGARHVRDLHPWNSREKKIEIRASSSIVTATFAAFTLTGVKKVPYIIYLLTYELGAEPLFFFLSFFFFLLYMHKYHNRLRFTLVYECVMCTRVFFSLYILLLLLFSPFRRRQSTKRCVRSLPKVPL